MSFILGQPVQPIIYPIVNPLNTDSMKVDFVKNYGDKAAPYKALDAFGNTSNSIK